MGEPLWSQPPYYVQYGYDNKKWYNLSGDGARSFDSVVVAMPWYKRIRDYKGLLQFVRIIDAIGRTVRWSRVKI